MRQRKGPGDDAEAPSSRSAENSASDVTSGTNKLIALARRQITRELAASLAANGM